MTSETDLILHLEQQQNERLARLETRIEVIVREMESNVHIVKLELQRLMEYQKEHESTLDTLNTVLNGSIVLKWIVTAVVITFSTIGVIATALEALKLK